MLNCFLATPKNRGIYNSWRQRVVVTEHVLIIIICFQFTKGLNIYHPLYQTCFGKSWYIGKLTIKLKYAPDVARIHHSPHPLSLSLRGQCIVHTRPTATPVKFARNKAMTPNTEFMPRNVYLSRLKTKTTCSHPLPNNSIAIPTDSTWPTNVRNWRLSADSYMELVFAHKYDMSISDFEQPPASPKHNQFLIITCSATCMFNAYVCLSARLRFRLGDPAAWRPDETPCAKEQRTSKKKHNARSRSVRHTHTPEM